MKHRVLRICLALPLALLLVAAAAFIALAEGHTLTVENGNGDGQYEAAEVVQITADAAPEGQVFCRWEASAGQLGDAYAAETTLTMPAGDATVTATYTDKTRVAITGLSVAGKTYDGAAVAVTGTAVSATTAETPETVEISASDLQYQYSSTDGAGYVSADPPKQAGAYRLIVTVADTNETYFGTSGAIAFTIARASLSVVPDGGQTRYVGCSNPVFTYTVSGAATAETPMFTGALSGAADASAAAGDYAIQAGTLALADGGTFLAKNYTLSVTTDVTYAVVPYETAAVASAAETNLGQNGYYTGDVTLTAPEGFTIALSQTDASFASSVTVPAPAGTVMQRYYLKVASGTDQNAVTGTKYIELKGDTSRPTAALYSPCAENAAVSGGQKIIFAVSEPVTGVSGKKITVAAGGTNYEADAGAGVLIGDAEHGPWYVRYDLSHFGLSLATDTAYTVSVEAGAFADTAGNVNAAYTDGAFHTASSAEGKLVVYTLDGTSTVTYGNAQTVLSGQALPAGTDLHFPETFGDGTQVTWTVYVDGQAVRDVNLTDYRLNADLEVYAGIGGAALPGELTMSGTPNYGETLGAVVTGADGLTLLYTWYSGSEAVQTGEQASYTVRGLDIGKKIRVRVTCASRDGALTYETAVVQKGQSLVAKPEPPQAAQKTATSVTLVRVAGMEYCMQASGQQPGAWQDSPVFSGLESGTEYQFVCRIKETTVRFASQQSDAAAIATYGALTGTIAVRGELIYGATLSASITGSNNEGTLLWSWLRGGVVVGSGSQYTVTEDDVEQTLTVEVSSTAQSGKVTASTGKIGRAPYAGVTPAAPTAAEYTATTVTLTSVDGCEYSSDGVKWQTATLFSGLNPGTAYTFYQRVRQTGTHLCSASSPGLQITTVPGLTGTVFINGEARYGKTITVTLENSNNSGELTYTWKRGTLIVGTGTSYSVQALDIGNQLSVEVISSVQYGSITRILGTVQKAEYVGLTPDAPTRLSVTSSKITLTPLIGFEYSKDGAVWQESNVFSGLKANTSYTFYQRVKATVSMEASPSSAGVTIRTSAGTSSGSDDSDSDDDSGTTGTDAVTALYTLTLTGSNTRVSAESLKSLIKGNETQDVTIKLDNASYTFFKGTMKATAGKIWYDFGVTIGGCIHEQAASTLAGDAYISTIHFNYDGDLPAQANIKLWLGAKNAGKTVYYYRFDPTAKTLTYLQTAVVDVDGWVTVVQSSCSDYVFCDAEPNADVLTATPMPAVSLATPEPGSALTAAPVVAAARTQFSGWVLALILIAALLLIIGGIWLWMRSKQN